jgi:hypothetical protein
MIILINKIEFFFSFKINLKENSIHHICIGYDLLTTYVMPKTSNTRIRNDRKDVGKMMMMVVGRLR